MIRRLLAAWRPRRRARANPAVRKAALANAGKLAHPERLALSGAVSVCR